MFLDPGSAAHHSLRSCCAAPGMTESILAALSRPSFEPKRPLRCEGRAGRRGLPVPTVHVRKWKAHGGLAARLPEVSRRPARGVLGLLRMNPGGDTRRAFGPPLYPPLAEPLTGATVFGIREAPDPEAPGDVRSARRAHTAWAAANLLRADSRPPHPRSANQTPLEDAPRLSRDEATLSEPRRGAVNYFSRLELLRVFRAGGK